MTTSGEGTAFSFFLFFHKKKTPPQNILAYFHRPGLQKEVVNIYDAESIFEFKG